MAFDRHIRIVLAGVFAAAAAARVAYILLNFDIDWEYDPYGHVVVAKSIYNHLPGSLWAAMGWWAKPLYTLFFGTLYEVLPRRWPALVMTQLANVAFWLAAVWLTLVVARETFEHRLTPVVLAVICGFSFITFRSSVSANTEPMGAFVLALGLYCWHRRHWLAASLCFGLVPLVRTDGAIIAAIFGLVAMLEAWRTQRWHGIADAFLRGALIASPTLLWYLANFIHAGDVLSGAVSGNLGLAAGVWGFGEPWDYVVSFGAFDPVPSLCFAFGAAFVLRRPRQAGDVLLISTLMALAYFVAMTVLWTWGLFGAAGFVRYFVYAYPLYILVAGVAVDRLLLHFVHSPRHSPEKAAVALSIGVALSLHWFAHGIVWINHNNSIPPASDLPRLNQFPVAWDEKPIYADYPEVIYYLCRGGRQCFYSPLTEIANLSAHGFFIFATNLSEDDTLGISLSSANGLALRGTIKGPYKQVIYVFER